MRSMDDKPTRADHVRKSEGRKIAAGGRRMPGGVMPPDTAAALDKLYAAGYGDSKSGCIFRAVVEAAEQLDRPGK